MCISLWFPCLMTSCKEKPPAQADSALVVVHPLSWGLTLRYMLLDTRVRCAVEAEIGKIEYVAPTSHLSALNRHLWDKRHVFASFLLLCSLNIFTQTLSQHIPVSIGP